jgi:elongation factor G
MNVYQTDDLRNIAVVGHGDCGKTTIASAMLFASGAMNRLGSVDDGTAPTDHDSEEIIRKISLQLAIAPIEWAGKKINIIDTPGYAAFSADAKAAMSVADCVLLCVEAVEGVQVITNRGFRSAADSELPIIFHLSKMDRERASFSRVLAEMQERFGREVTPIQLPIGEENDFTGVVDLVSRKATTFATDGSGKAGKAEIPESMTDAVEEARGALMEMVAETDDELMEAFFESGELNAEQLQSGLSKAIAERKIFPVTCSSALKMVGIQSVLDYLVSLAPDPTVRAAVGSDPVSGEEIERPTADDQPVSAFVFKSIVDEYAGRLSIFRVKTGLLKSDGSLVNIRADQTERLGGLNTMSGKELSHIDQLHAGDIGVLAKLKDTHTGDTLCDPAHPIVYPKTVFPPAAISFALEPKSKGDEEKISVALAKLTEEDPVLKVSRDPQTNELIVAGTAQIHVEVALSKMSHKFGVEATLKLPKVPYLETITRKVENVEGKHKKQSGGRGQFGVCVIHMEPLPRGSGIEFVDKIFGGSIPQNYRPAVEKGVRESAERGWLSGNPLIDFRVTLVDGKYHNVDSSEMAFKIAGSIAFKAAMEKVAPTILEPIMSVEITAPEEYMGDIMGELSSRRGKPQGMEAQGNHQLIKAQVPLAEMLDFANKLKSMTSDRGSYEMEFDHQAEAPASIRKKIADDFAKSKAQPTG